MSSDPIEPEVQAFFDNIANEKENEKNSDDVKML